MIKIFIKSFIVGICAILPGVSGSVIAVSLGLYEKFVNSIISFRVMKQNKAFVVIVTLGILCGFYLTSSVLMYVLKFETILSYILLGIIFSDLPFLIKKVLNNGDKKIKFMPLILAFLISLLLEFISTGKIVNFNISFKYFLGGILFAFGKVFPGISSSFFLLCLGIYQDIIFIIINPWTLITNFHYYLPFIIGTIIGLIVFLKLLSYLLQNKFNTIYSMIIGFVLSSSFALLPRFEPDIQNVFGILLMIIFFVTFLYIKKKKDV